MAVELKYTSGETRTISDVKTYRFIDGFIELVDNQKKTRMIVQASHVKEVVFYTHQEEKEQEMLLEEDSRHDVDIVSWLLQELYNLGINGMTLPTTENTTIDEFTEGEWFAIKKVIESHWSIRLHEMDGIETLEDVAGIIQDLKMKKR